MFTIDKQKNNKLLQLRKRGAPRQPAKSSTFQFVHQ